MKTKHHITVGHASGRCATIPFGGYIQAIICYPKGSRRTKKRAKRGKGKGRVVSLRFDPRKYTLSKAKTWARQHGYTVLKTAEAGTTQKRKKKKKITKKRTIKKRAKKTTKKAKKKITRKIAKKKVCKKRGCKVMVSKSKGPGRPPLYCKKHRKAV